MGWLVGIDIHILVGTLLRSVPLWEIVPQCFVLTCPEARSSSTFRLFVALRFARAPHADGVLFYRKPRILKVLV